MNNEKQEIKKLTAEEAEALRRLIDTGASEDQAIVIEPKQGVVGLGNEGFSSESSLNKVARFKTHYL